VASGTAALELCLRALRIGGGDEVIVPTNSFIATAAAVAAVGAEPIFVDVDPGTLLINADAVEASLSPRTAAVIVVHLYGQVADIEPIARVAAKAGVACIEDAAQAHGATWKGRPVGGLVDAGCFSFYPSKNLGAFGDAGAVTTNDPALADRVRSLSNHGRIPGRPEIHASLGGNDRLDALQAAILSVKLARLDDWVAKRRRVAAWYRERLCRVPVVQPEQVARTEPAHSLAVVQVEDRDRVRMELSRAGIATGIHYPVPCHRQPAFASRASRLLPISERAAGRVLSLPMFPHLTEAMVDRVVEAIVQATSWQKPRLRQVS
jgi:dTDP-4-amino-4,6-dideoxygalactose transaminase